jgi:dTMP kinase
MTGTGENRVEGADGVLGGIARGKFITLEGIDGAGKSTHARTLAGALQARGKTVLLTREPGGTPLAERLRELLLHQSMHLETEALLMFAARREHLDQLIFPALAAGNWVVSDRFTDASFAYQGGGRGLPTARLEALEQWVQGSFQPDLTLLFDVPVAVARGRMGRDAKLDRFEREGEAFFERVRQAYLVRAAAAPGRIKVIDASQSISDIKNILDEISITIGN